VFRAASWIGSVDAGDRPTALRFLDRADPLDHVDLRAAAGTRPDGAWPPGPATSLSRSIAEGTALPPKPTAAEVAEDEQHDEDDGDDDDDVFGTHRLLPPAPILRRAHDATV
jgi:hypothetical protein